jgi:hypothetical protein
VPEGDGVAEAKVEACGEPLGGGRVPVALPVASCVDQEAASADPVAEAPPEPTPLWEASPADERGVPRPQDDDAILERQFRFDLRRAVEDSLNPSRTYAADERKDVEEEADDGALLEDVDTAKPGSRRRRRWSYALDKSDGGGGGLVHALHVEEAFPTVRGTKYYVGRRHLFADDRLTLNDVGRWFRDCAALDSESDGDLEKVTTAGDAAAPPPPPSPGRAAPAVAEDDVIANRRGPEISLLAVRDLIKSSAICGGEWREGPAHDADLDIGVGDLVRFRLRGSPAVDEYGVVAWQSPARVDGVRRSAGAHVQVCAHACGMLVPKHEIAFGVSRDYGDVIDVILKDFSMEIQLRPNKFLFIFEPDAVVFATMAVASPPNAGDEPLSP